MKKVIYYILIPLMLLALIGIFIFQSKRVTPVSTDLYDSKSGMRITVVSGSSGPNNGNRTNLCYLIRTNKDKLIIVDGGDGYIDYTFLYDYIVKYGNGKVNYWYITHAHSDHSGAICKLLNDDNYNIEIENLYYSLNTLDWYKEYDERGYESEKLMIESLDSPKIKNQVNCYKNQIINMDNIKCEILKIANPEITMSDNGNDSSMCFKMTAEDINKSMIFLGDAYIYSSKELLENPEKLNTFAVQMAHHGQNGVTKEVYDAMKPTLCFFSTPQWLYDNNNGTGYNTGGWKTVITREWLKEYNSDIVASFIGDQYFRLYEDGYEVLDENDDVLYKIEK